jgi:hypothetical protein
MSSLLFRIYFKYSHNSQVRVNGASSRSFLSRLTGFQQQCTKSWETYCETIRQNNASKRRNINHNCQWVESNCVHDVIICSQGRSKQKNCDVYTRIEMVRVVQQNHMCVSNTTTLSTEVRSGSTFQTILVCMVKTVNSNWLFLERDKAPVHHLRVFFISQFICKL